MTGLESYCCKSMYFLDSTYRFIISASAFNFTSDHAPARLATRGFGGGNKSKAEIHVRKGKLASLKSVP